MTKGTGAVRFIPIFIGSDRLTVVGHGLSVWRANAENNTREYVLEAGHKEERGVLRVLDAWLVLSQVRRDIPTFLLTQARRNADLMTYHGCL